MSGQIGTGAFRFDQNEVATTSPKTVVHASSADRILGFNLVGIAQTPSQGIEERIHCPQASGHLALSEPLVSRQVCDQRFEVCQVRHVAESTPLCTPRAHARRDHPAGRRSRTISVRMPSAEAGWKKEAVMSSIGSPKSM